MIDLDLEMEGVDPPTKKEVITSGADQGGGQTSEIFKMIFLYCKAFPGSDKKKTFLRTTGIYSKQHISLRKPNLHYVPAK